MKPFLNKSERDRIKHIEIEKTVKKMIRKDVAEYDTKKFKEIL